MREHDDNYRMGRPTSPDAFTSSQHLSPRETGDALLSCRGRPDTHPRSYLETFAAIIRDRRVSHGAFRLWHALRDYTDHTSRCFPGQRRLANDIGCDIHSLKRWTSELVEAGWLEVAEGKSGEGFTYIVMGGIGQPLRKAASPTVVENRNGGVVENHNRGVAENHNRGVAENHNGPLWKTATKVRSPINQAHLSKWVNAPNTPNNFIPD